MYFDTHAHYDDKAFDTDRETVLQAAHTSGVALILDPGCDVKSSRAAITLAERHDFVCFAAGWHPEDRETLTEERFAEMLRLLDHPKCVAIGEIGLAGECRAVSSLEARVRECERLGFTEIAVPLRNVEKRKITAGPGVKLIPVRSVFELLPLLGEKKE